MKITVTVNPDGGTVLELDGNRLGTSTGQVVPDGGQAPLGGLPRLTSPTAKRREIARRQQRCRDLVNRVKLERGCADCGYNAHAIALDFDHLPGADKVAGVARLARAGSVSRLVVEIAKCEVVCANCHRVRSLLRGDFLNLGTVA